jgi:hypothetical protein
MLITRRTVYPGQAGSKKWQKLYGDKLLCVRYKYDNHDNKRITTIELIADEQEWKPNKTIIPKNKIVQLRINYGEVDLARKVKSVGGRWNKEKKVWELAYGYVQALGLAKRIVD